MATLTLNQELNGIEVKFESKPATATLDALKKIGFRWHNQKKIWYAKQTKQRLELARAITNAEDYAEQIRQEEPKTKAQKVNKYGVKVGDIFSASWGYEQTNNNFFQVIELVGACSVRVREVCPKLVKTEAVSGMSEDRTFKIDGELLPPVSHSVFIKDQERGDLKRLKSYSADGVSNPQFYLDSFADAHYCKSGEVTVYESWYY